MAVAVINISTDT